MTIYNINYLGHEEQCITANNFTETGGPNYHLITLGGENETIYNCYSWLEMEKFIAKHKGVKKQAKIIL